MTPAASPRSRQIFVPIAAKDLANRMVSDTAVVGLLSLVAKALGAIKLVIAARWFGVSAEMDSFVIAFLVPSLIAEVFVAPIEPALMASLASSKQRQEIFTSCLWRTCLRLVLAGCAVSVAAVALSSVLSARFLGMVIVLSPVLVLMGVVTIARSALLTERRFLEAAILPAAPPAAAIVILWLRGSAWGVQALVMGALIGAALEAILALTFAWRAGYRARLSVGEGLMQEELQSAYRPALAMAVVLSGTPALDQWFAGTLSAGDAATFSLGTRLSAMLSALGATVIGAVASSHFSGLVGELRWSALISVQRRYGRTVWSLAVALLLVLVVASPAMLSWGLSGSALRGESLAAVSLTQQISLAQFPFSILVALHARTLLSLGEGKRLFRVSVLLVGVAVLGDIAGSRGAGLPGLCISGVVSRGIAAMWLWWMVNHTMKARQGAA